MVEKKIFVVDDDANLTSFVRDGLQETGNYEVFTENNSENAYAAIRQVRPDLILIDVNMPQISGGELANQIKEDPDLAGIPIIFITAIVSRAEVEAKGGMMAGHPFIAKPATLEEIMKIIEANL